MNFEICTLQAGYRAEAKIVGFGPDVRAYVLVHNIDIFFAARMKLFSKQLAMDEFELNIG